MMKIYVRPRFRKLKDNEYYDFWCSLRDAKKINNHGDFVLLRELDVYKESQNFLLGNGIAGFSVCDGELISVHKNNKKAEETNVKHILPKMVRCAFKYGAVFGDCYGEFLANYYMKSGFIVVAKVPFDAFGDNPNNWLFDKFGKPYIYLLMRGVKNIVELDSLRNNNSIQGFDAVKDCIPLIDSPEVAEEYRLKLYNRVKNLSYRNRLKYIQNLRNN